MMVVWLTGLSSAGKSTLGHELGARLRALDHRVEVLDGDAVRKHLCKDLGFSKADRDENIRRIIYVAELLGRHGVVTIVSAISPYREVREEARQRLPSFVEVYVNAPLAVCEGRDRKGLYGKARAGQITMLTGVSDPYEPPLTPEVECHTDRETVAQSVDKILEYVLPRLSR